MPFPWLREMLGVLEVQSEETPLPTRSKLNFSGSRFSVADDPANNRTNVTIEAPVAVHGLEHSPIGLWQFNETLNDTSGNGRNLALVAGATRYTEIFPGIRALQLLTTTRYNFSTTGTALQRTGDITIEMLVCLNAIPTANAFIAYDAAGETEAANTLYNVGITSDSLIWLSESGAGVDATYSPGRLPPLGELCHLAVRRSANVVQFFCNGTPLGAASSALTTPTGGTTATLSLGAAGGTTPLAAMASLKIIASALTDNDVKAEYNRTLGPYLGRAA